METHDATPNVDVVLTILGGCGRFQVILNAILFLCTTSAPFSLMFMAFGNYNPGWSCLDNASHVNNTTWEYDDCTKFESCQTIQFNPETSTIVSEWGLICDKVWIPSLIISIQMAGVLIGAIIVGYMEDILGRKAVYCTANLLMSIFNFITYFSNSWQMFTVMRFLIGLMHTTLIVMPQVIGFEFSTYKWRGVIGSVPTWSLGTILFSLSAVLTKDWRQLHLLTAGVSLALFFPVLWVPESLRWLALRNKTNDVINLTKQIAKHNRVPLLNTPDLNALCDVYAKDKNQTGRYSWRQLFKGNYRRITFLTTPLWFTLSLMYYAIGFGIKSLSGDFYLNLIISSVLDIPCVFLTSLIPNLLGRKKGLLSHQMSITLVVVLIVVLDRLVSSDNKGRGIMALAMITKIISSTEYSILSIYTGEIYPTVIRTTSLGYGSLVARIGGILAPYLIPSNSDIYYISYSVMAGLSLVCSVLIVFLYDAKGQELVDTWDDSGAPNYDERDRELNVSISRSV